MKTHHDRPSIDGFTLKRRGPDTGMMPASGRADVQAVSHEHEHRLQRKAGFSTPSAAVSSGILPKPQMTRGSGLQRAAIDESLRAIDETPIKKPKKRRRLASKKSVLLVLALLVIGTSGYFVTKFVMAGGRVFSGSVLDLFGGGTPLQKDATGRTNILIFGTSEDDRGHDGASLTDSIMLLSMNQEKKTAAMVSVPRDLWVLLDTPCTFGNEGKINIVYECGGAVDGNIEKIDVAKGAAALQKKTGEIFGLNVQYYVKVGYNVVRDVTTSLGGVTVNVKAAFGADGIYDSNTKLSLPNGPATLKGEQALAFVRARGEGYGSYGLNGNFSREENQQKMLVAIRDKALTVGTLANPVAVSNLLDALGDNIRTNFTAGEIKTLAIIGKDVPPANVTSVSLVTDKKPVVTTALYNAQSIVRPIAGLTDYSEISRYVKQQLDGGDVSTEDASIQVLNGSGESGAAANKQTMLTQAGFYNITTGNSSYRPTAELVWYDLSAGSKPKTLQKLVETLGLQPKGTKLPSGVQSTSNFVIILGNGTH